MSMEAREARLIEALESAQAFLETVTAWIGHDDDLTDTAADIDEALGSVELAETKGEK